MPPGSRFKRSRILWDHATSDNNNNYKNWLRAILYELQPIRMTELLRLYDGLFHNMKSIFYCMTNITTKTVPTQTSQFVAWLKTTTIRQWLLLFGVIVYYMFVRYIHNILDAGPIVLIITCFILIFTIGLSDDEQTDGLSAYSVFNKGFQKLLGSVDADALVQQHVGGGGGGMGMAGGAAALHDDDDDDIDEQEVPGVIARRRRQQRQRPPVPAPLLRPAADQAPREQQAAVLRDDNNDDNDDDDSNNNDYDNNEQQQQPENNNNNRSRRSNKKTRRSRNVEQRREIQQQRQAAVAMGFGGENEGFAMNRLFVEDQVAGDEER